MRKFIYSILCLSLLVGFYSCDKNDDYKMGDYTQVDGYYPFFANKGALVNNKRPHSGQNFQVQLNYFSKTPVSKVTLLGKIVGGSRLGTSSRYTDLVPIQSFTAEQLAQKGGFSKEAKVDTIVFNWNVPSEIANNAGYVYYKVAVENVNALSDTTSGDYWKVVAEDSKATLNELLIDDELVDGFDKATYDYRVLLPAGTTQAPTVTAVPTNAAVSQIVISNAADLKGTPDQRTTTVKVVAEDGVTTLTYSIEFVVAAS